MNSLRRSSKAQDEAAIAIHIARPAAPPRWLSMALHLHQQALDLDAIAAALSEAGHPPAAVDLALAAIRSDMRRLGLFWSRLAPR